MSLGYTKGKFWIPDTRFDHYASRDSYRALSRANVKAGIATNVEFSYTSQRYMAEVKTIERFEKSAQTYIITHGNAYDPNPMAALCTALRKHDGISLLQRACILEIECELLLDAYRAAVAREKRMAIITDKIEAAIYELGVLLERVPVVLMQGEEVIAQSTVGELKSKPAKVIDYGDLDDDL